MRTRPLLGALVAVLLVSLLLPARSHAQDAARRAGTAPAGDGELYRMALTGDAIITRRLSVYREPAFVRLMDLIRGADVAFTNLEVLFHDYEPYPMHSSGGTYMRAEPELARELVWAGFDLVSLANNHTGDYGADGMRLTIRHVRDAGLVAAGAGENLYEAREARFVETHGARVALISTASTFTDHSVAGKPQGAVRGRPGLSPLRHTRTRIITQAQADSLRAGLRAAGLSAGSGSSFTIFGERFAIGDAPATRTEPDAEDVAEIGAVVRNAAALADYVIVSIHAHEGTTRAPAEFVQTFARAMIDAGADVIVGHGPHYLRGIEIYRGKPIFYSLGDFIFQNETLLRLPYENYRRYDLGEDHHVADFNAARYANDTRGFPTNREIWESVVAIPRWRGRQLVDIELHPITLGFGRPATERGRPLLADQELGRKIINDLSERSRLLGTTVEWRDGIGVIRVAPVTAGPGG
jgi:poly-gamma-glutamate capsule biosynthesis protein CapA/YwtB (metallophosphatase superfamily)